MMLMMWWTEKEVYERNVVMKFIFKNLLLSTS